MPNGCIAVCSVLQFTVDLPLKFHLPSRAVAKWVVEQLAAECADLEGIVSQRAHDRRNRNTKHDAVCEHDCTPMHNACSTCSANKYQPWYIPGTLQSIVVRAYISYNGHRKPSR